LDGALDELDASEDPKVHEVHSESAGEDDAESAVPSRALSETGPPPLGGEASGKVHEVHPESANDPSRPWLTRPHDPDAIEALRERIRRRQAFGCGIQDLPDPDVLEAERLAAASAEVEPRYPSCEKAWP
ncbi:MAG TPA: hypothetical protein VF559_13075, partial [Caulobacteraceae bacterium]